VWKDEVVAYIKTVFQHSCRETAEKNKKASVRRQAFVMRIKIGSSQVANSVLNGHVRNMISSVHGKIIIKMIEQKLNVKIDLDYTGTE
jgi:hypothetical protein